jgi:hypothetical protein
VRPVLLRSVDFFPVYEIIGMILWHHVLWQNSIVLSLVVLLIIVFMETHGHRRCHVLGSSHAAHASNIVLVVVHFEYLLLLGSQILVDWWAPTSILVGLSSVHYCKAHGAWHKDIVLPILPSTGCFDLGLIHEIICMLNMMSWLALSTWLLHRLEMLMMCWWSVLVRVVGDISAVLNHVLIGSKCSFLVVTVELLDVQASSSLMRSEGLASL